MTFLTRFEINTARRGAKDLLSSPQRLHAAVAGAFTAFEHDSDDHRVLWRVDATRERTWLYIVSSTEPDLTHLVEQAGWPTKPVWQTRDYTPLLDKLDTGQQWAFRLAANPVFTGRINGAKKKLACTTAAGQLDWLLNRCESLGISIPEASSGYPDVTLGQMRSAAFRHDASTVTLGSVVYDGRLEVVDSALLRSALINGIGRSKAYGCGLMTLAHLS